MGSGSLIVHGGILVDDLTFADGTTMNGVLGGAALHALAGAALWSDDVLLLGGVGRDAGSDVLPWMHAQRLSPAGLFINGDSTPRNNLVYRIDGSRTETPVFGPEHFDRLQPGAEELTARLPQVAGAYVFHDANPQFWAPVLQAAREHPAVLLWEISAECCVPQKLADIAAIARGIASISLNLQEAADIFGQKPRHELIDAIRSLGAVVTFLRCGAEGSIAISAHDATPIPAYPASVTDVTGAGNAYGGGALAGLAQGAAPADAARMGAFAASLAVGQYGLFNPRDAEVRRIARAALSSLSPFPHRNW